MEASYEKEKWSEGKKSGGRDKRKERGVRMKGGWDGGIGGGRQRMESGEEKRRKRRGDYMAFNEMEG